MVNMRPFTAFEQKNLKFLVNHNVKFTQVEITPTGLGKGILDSTAPMRAYFLEMVFITMKNNFKVKNISRLKQHVFLQTRLNSLQRSPFIALIQRKVTLECGFTALVHILKVTTFMYCFGMKKHYIASISLTLILKNATTPP